MQPDRDPLVEDYLALHSPDASFGAQFGEPAPAPTPVAAEPFELQVRTAPEVCAIPDPPEGAMLLGPLVVRAQRTIIVGATGHGKTSLAAQIAAAILTGDDMIGYHGAGDGPVLLVDLEQGLRSIKRGLRQSGLADRHDVLVVSVPDGLALDSEPQHVAELDRVIGLHRPVLVVLDPYYKAHRADDPNQERPIVELMRLLDALRARHGFALLLPAHPRKDAPGRDGPRKLTLDDISGSGAVVRGAEVVLGIERLSHGYARLRVLKDRDGDLPVGEAWPLLYSRDDGFRLDPKEQRTDDEAEQQILETADTLRTVKEWASELGLRETRTRAILDGLVDAGSLTMVVGPPGRSAKAKCYGSATAPTLRDQSGAVAQSLLDSVTAPTAPDMLLGAVGHGSSRTNGTEPGAVTAPEPLDQDEYDRLAALAKEPGA